jgi:hypothetical protein
VALARRGRRPRRRGRPHSAGGTGPNSVTDGVPKAVARCETPVSPHATRPAAPMTAASSYRFVRPARMASSGSCASSATSSARRRSPGPPVTRTVRPAERSWRATSAQRPGGQRRETDAAPGWITVAPAVQASATGSAGGGSPSSPGSAGIPCADSIRHQRSTSCSPERHRGAPGSGWAWGWAKAMSRAGVAARSTRWDCGPRPWRFTATSASRAAGGSGASPWWSITAWTAGSAPDRTSATSGDRTCGATRSRSWSGWARASAFSAGTAVSRSPRPSARSTTSRGRPNLPARRVRPGVTARRAPWVA